MVKRRWLLGMSRYIKCIKSSSLDELDNNMEMYGVCWSNLRFHCFADMNCVYWIDLYADIFSKKFKLNKEQLQSRLNVPNEIKKEGAKAVADFLNNT